VATVAYGAGLAAPGAIGGLASLTSLRGSFVLITVLVAIVAIAAGVLRSRQESVGEALDEPEMSSAAAN
jgi:hypothetical protein